MYDSLGRFRVTCRAVAWYVNRSVDPAQIEPDHVYRNVARAFLPAVLPELLGVFLASLLASLTSSFDAFIISSSRLFTENIYRPLTSARHRSKNPSRLRCPFLSAVERLN